MARIHELLWGTFLFVQILPASGFVWRDDLEPRFDEPQPDRAPGNEEGPWLTAVDWMDPIVSWGRVVGPLGAHRESKHGLHRDFARVDPEREEILKFASRYGFLGHGEHLLFDPTLPVGRGGHLQYGEGLGSWLEEIGKMRTLTKAWDHTVGAPEALGEFVSWDRIEGRPFVEVRLPGFELWSSLRNIHPLLARDWVFGDTAVPVQFAICAAVNDRMRGHVAPTVLPQLGSLIKDVPDCLLGMLYASFALEIAGVHAPPRVCAAPDCGKGFTPGKGFGRYCSRRCQMRTYMRERRRKEKEDGV